MADTNEEIGGRIAKIRKAKKLKQSDLAKMLGTTGSAIGNYERGDRVIPAETISKISKSLSVPTDILIKGIPDKMKDSYSYNFFANADSDELQKYYAELNEVENEELYEEQEKQYDYLKHYLKSIYGMNEYNAQNDLAEFVKWQKKSITNEQRLSNIKYSPERLEENLKFDPFEKYDKEMEEIKAKHYHMYFLDPVQKQLKQIIDNLDTSKEMNKDKLKEELQNILSTIEERDLDN